MKFRCFLVHTSLIEGEGEASRAHSCGGNRTSPSDGLVRRGGESKEESVHVSKRENTVVVNKGETVCACVCVCVRVCTRVCARMCVCV